MLLLNKALFWDWYVASSSVSIEGHINHLPIMQNYCPRNGFKWKWVSIIRVIAPGSKPLATPGRTMITSLERKKPLLSFTLKDIEILSEFRTHLFHHSLFRLFTKDEFKVVVLLMFLLKLPFWWNHLHLIRGRVTSTEWLSWLAKGKQHTFHWPFFFFFFLYFVFFVPGYTQNWFSLHLLLLYLNTKIHF